ncbi:peptidase M20 domain-containing protein 2 [Strongylocentrotus purpuratus]|uniref:Peptidase M20 domain-containing protein 2 n=1 Tax=Strongylocentrotus purpuratus TaxID=7668 RepID=A0A7M7HCH3_STRPU|nr:peptidase M20 domain-containing protein 2 [Strongylocentrotus purpuratus]XP_795122.4 peptidase M20 domain-containing protein 2 [Strongylocentrotus purpuratus]
MSNQDSALLRRSKDAAGAKIDESAAALHELSNDIWTHPELNFEERHAHASLTDFLEREGFEVTKNFHLETAFKATYGTDGGVHVCVICEYDALPEIDHACGHPLIAESGAAAGLGIKAALELADAPKGRVTVMGTPAEEGGGGKIKMIETGAFQGIDVAMMVHPYPRNVSRPVILACTTMEITFTGRAAHASSCPWEGVNALDAAILCYQNISVMRQQLKPEWRVHGTIMKAGDTPSIIPEESQMSFYLRTVDSVDMPTLKEKIGGCAKGAATATGCEVKYSFGGDYANLVTNDTLASVYERQLTDLSVDYSTSEVTFSTDMGDVSYVVPSIHPLFYIGTEAANHSREFNTATGADEAQKPTLAQAKAMAFTGLELMQPGNSHLLDKIKKEFNNKVAPK